MNDTTLSDLSALQEEETRRELILLFEPMVQRWFENSGVSQAVEEMRLSREALSEARQSLDAARAEIEELRATFITEERAREIGKGIGDGIQKPLNQKIEEHLTTLTEDEQRRSQAQDARIGEVNALALTNQQELATSKALYDEQIKTLSTRLTKVESDIQTGVSKVEKNTRTLSVTIGKYLTETRTQREKDAADIKALQAAKTTIEAQMLEVKDDALNLRGDVDGLRGDIATKVTTTDLKVQNIAAQMVEVKQHQTNHQAQLIDLSATFAEFQIQLKSAMWLLNTWGGRAVLFTVLTLLGISNLVN